MYDPYAPINALRPATADATLLQLAEVTVANADGTFDVRFARSRASRSSVPVRAGAQPVVGDVVVVGHLDGDPQLPFLVGPGGGGGEPGPANSLAIGTVTTGVAGSAAAAAITGAPPAQTLSLTIPRGDPGTNGATGRGFLPRGAWVSGTAYAVDDVVIDGGETFRRKVAGAGATVPSGDAANWEKWAAKGATGPTGSGTMDVWHTVGAAGEPAFLNSWVNYDTASFHAAGFRKDPFGRVRLRGLIKNGVQGVGTPAFTLPVGYRPAKEEGFANGTNSTQPELRVQPNGNVYVTGQGGYAFLDGVDFDTDSVTTYLTGPQGLDGPVGPVGPAGTPRAFALKRQATVGTAAYTTATGVAAAIDATNVAATVITNGGTIRAMLAWGNMAASFATENVGLDLYVDGVFSGRRFFSIPVTGNAFAGVIEWLVPGLAAGSHSFEVRWWRSSASGTVTLQRNDVTPLEFTVEEIPTAAVDVKPARVTTLPPTPTDGQEVYYVAGANGELWHLRYNAASASPYKWESVGGPALYAAVEPAETSAATAFGDLATVGPSITVPLAGDYEVRFGSLGINNGPQVNVHSLAVGATAAADGLSARGGGIASVQASSTRTRRLNGLTAATALVSKYRVTGGTGSWEQRWLAVVPVRVG